MTTLLSQLLTWLLLYGYPIVSGCIFIGYLGIPVPSEALLLAAGAISADGGLNIWILIPMVTLTALGGDILGYWIGKKYGIWFIHKYGGIFHLNQTKIRQIDYLFKKWESGVIFITRWLLTPLAVPVNLLSGVSGYPFKKFILLALIGELTWGSLFIGLGYLLGANWLSLLEIINNFLSTIFFGTIGVILISSTIWVIKKQTKT